MAKKIKVLATAKEEGLKNAIEISGKSEIDLDEANTVDAALKKAEDYTDSNYLVSRDIFNELLERQKDVLGKLNESLSIKDNFLAIMSHELRTPLNSISGFTELLQSGDLTKDQTKFIGHILEASNMMLQIVEDLFETINLENRRINLDAKSFPIQNLIDALETAFKDKLKNRNLTLSKSISENTPANIIGDEARLLQILKHLVDNAIKFSENNSVELGIKATLSQNEPAQLLFSVTDHGAGIDKEKLPFIFDKFVQADNTSTRHYGGTGLGLSICSELVTLMNGSIEVESTMGKGSKFYFEVPLLTDAPAEKNEQSVSTRPFKGKRILLLEDTKSHQILAKTILTNLGASLNVANSGKEGLHMCKQFTFDAIVCDVMMDDMDGIEFTTKFRQMEASGTRIPIIGLSALSADEHSERAILAGMSDYLTKPFKSKQLKDMLIKEFNK